MRNVPEPGDRVLPGCCLGAAASGGRTNSDRRRHRPLARVPYLDQQDLAAEHRDLLKRSVNIVRALANSPNGLREFSALSNFIRFKSRLDPRLRELAVSDVTFAELRAGLDNERIVDLVVTIAFYNAVVRVLASLQIDVEGDYQRYLDEFPLPSGAP